MSSLSQLVIASMLFCSEVTVSDMLPTCLSGDFKYSFTECDDLGGRWRVSVPKGPSICVGGAPNAAIRVDKCYTSCGSGHFFNSTSLSCEKCLPGSYSLGGGIKIESFKSDVLPPGFRISTQTIKSSGSCSGWRNISNYIESVANSSADGCVSKISYTVRIVKKGKLSFRYQYSVADDLTNAILFTFQYHNYDDSENRDSPVDDAEANTKFMAVTSDQKWKDFQIDLVKPGLYVFVWRSVMIGRSKSFFQNTVVTRSPYWLTAHTGSHSDSGVVRLKNIFVEGVDYASKCSPCESGTYTDASGAGTCTPCPANTEYSGIGAIKCKDCEADTKYSPKGSEHCLERPICNHNDYYSIESECDYSRQRRRVDYRWIEPKICRDSKDIFPKPVYQQCNETTENQRKMDRCNLGQELGEDGNCHFCRDNQYRDHSTDKCHSCPISTSPFHALSYRVWHSGRPNDNSLPDFFTTECVRTDEDYEYDCDPTNVWFSSPMEKHFIRTGPSTSLGAYLFLTLSVPGFRQQSGGELTFSFEMECAAGDYCLLILMESKRNAKLSQQTNIIKEWNQQSVGLQTYRHPIPQNISISFSWIFQRNQSFESSAKIYEITLTNAMNSSAIRCNPCPHSNANCIACPFGQYYETSDSNDTESSPIEETSYRVHRSPTDQLCKQCPKNFVINSSLTFPIGSKESCVKCGPGLTDYKGVTCHSDCRLQIDGDSFDLTPLKQPLIYKGGVLFTAGGTKYYHLFNITLCGNPNFKAVCTNNISTFDANDAMLEDYGIQSMICRSTIIPDGEQTMAAQSVTLGDQLIGITRSTTFQNITVHEEFQQTNSDLHFYYSTPVPTAACPNGRRLTLTLRCSPELDQDLKITTPRSCADGTCDGCTFHLLVRTKTSAACRLCRPSDYETVVGECVEGMQKIHFVNPKGCVLSTDGKNKVESRPCSVIPRQVQIGIALVSAIGVILLALVFHFWKKNRSLEYKYCKLIEGNEKSAECCAEDEDDEDNDNDDQVMIHPKKPKEVYEEGYETIQLTKHNDRNTDII